MPGSTTKLNKRAQRLVDECVQLATLLGRFRDAPSEEARVAAVSDFRQRLEAQAEPAIERERGQLELEKRRRFTAKSDVLLKSAGPRVITVPLRDSGTAVFMQRMDLLDVVTEGSLIPETLTGHVLEIIESGGVTEDMLTAKRLSETRQTMRTIACAVCVLPPAEYFEDPSIDVEDIDPRDCRPLFVMPGSSPADGQLPIFVSELDSRPDGWRGLSQNDLRSLVQAAIDNGPGAMLTFRLRQESLVADALDGDDDEPATEPDPGHPVSVGGRRPRQSRRAVRAVG